LLSAPFVKNCLQQAQELIIAKGFVATTVDEIRKAAGLTEDYSD
jgi:hypothetical protein